MLSDFVDEKPVAGFSHSIHLLHTYFVCKMDAENCCAMSFNMFFLCFVSEIITLCHLIINSCFSKGDNIVNGYEYEKT